MSVKFTLDTRDIELLEPKLQKIRDQSEKVLNEILHEFGLETVMSRITDLIPVSDVDKKHARSSNPLRNITFNLGFEVLPKKPYAYLVFPDKALGTSQGNAAKEFMVQGLESSTNLIMDKINEEIDKLIKEEF